MTSELCIENGWSGVLNIMQTEDGIQVTIGIDRKVLKHERVTIYIVRGEYRPH